MNILIFTGGEAAAPKKFSDFFSQRKFQYVIAADSGLDTFESYSSFYKKINPLKLNFILGDMDSVKNRKLIKKYKDVPHKFCSHDKDFSDTELALMKAHEVAKKSTEENTIILVGAGGGRIDHLLGVWETFSKDFSADIWLSNEQKITKLSEGKSIELCNLKFEERISISCIKLGNEGKGLVLTEGLEWSPAETENTGLISLSNRISKNHLEKNLPVKLTASKGDFLILT